MVARSIAEVETIARQADNHALAAHEEVGHVARELASMRALIVRGFDGLGGRVDACRDDVRTLARDVRTLKLAEDAMRKELASFTDLDALAGMTEREAKRLRRARWLRRTGLAALRKVLVGAAYLTVLVVALWALHALGVHVPKELLQ